MIKQLVTRVVLLCALLCPNAALHAQNMVKVDFRTYPTGATVVYQRKVIGVTPFVFDLLEGIHTFTFRLEGYAEHTKSSFLFGTSGLVSANMDKASPPKDVIYIGSAEVLGAHWTRENLLYFFYIPVKSTFVLDLFQQRLLPSAKPFDWIDDPAMANAMQVEMPHLAPEMPMRQSPSGRHLAFVDKNNGFVIYDLQQKIAYIWGDQGDLQLSAASMDWAADELSVKISWSVYATHFFILGSSLQKPRFDPLFPKEGGGEVTLEFGGVLGAPSVDKLVIARGYSLLDKSSTWLLDLSDLKKPAKRLLAERALDARFSDDGQQVLAITQTGVYRIQLETMQITKIWDAVAFGYNGFVEAYISPSLEYALINLGVAETYEQVIVRLPK